MITQYIRTPFANGGDKEDIPQDVQTSGSISWPEGWGADYELDIETEPDAKPIDRLDMNQLFNVITQGLKFLQENFAPEWITASANGGTAFQYQTGQTVTYVDGSGNRALWVSLIDNNTATPGSDASKWGPYLLRSANGSEVAAGTGNYPVLPQQVLELIEDNRQTINDATTKQKGIVQLSDSLDGKSGSLAATESAVGKKFTVRGQLGATDLDTLNNTASLGIWHQTSDSAATEANGYPPGVSAGVLIVAGIIYQYPAQIYFSPLQGTVWQRRQLATNQPYDKWRPANPEVAAATLKAAGIVRLSNGLDGTSESLAATEKAVGQKVTFRGYLEKATDLNSLTNVTDMGIYCQQANGNATLAKNYPAEYAGILYALGSIQDAPFQMYVTLRGDTYTRYYNGSSAGTWSAWKQTNGNAMPAGIVNFIATAGNGTAPANMLVCNGATVSRTKYPRLFAQIGTRYGTGDGSTTFTIPNIPVNYSLVANTGNTKLAVSTVGQNLSHTHTATTAAAGVHTHTGSTASAGAHTHTAPRAQNNDVGGGRPNFTTANYTNGVTAATNSAGAHTHTLDLDDAGSHSHTVKVAAQGGSLNVAAGFYMLPCITF